MSNTKLEHNPTEWKSMKVAQLKELCEAYKIDSKGTKAQMIERLEEYCKNPLNNNNSSNDNDTNKDSKEVKETLNSKSNEDNSTKALSDKNISVNSANPSDNTNASISASTKIDASNDSTNGKLETDTSTGVAINNGKSWEDIVKKEAEENGEVLTEAQIKVRARTKRFGVSSPVVSTSNESTQANSSKKSAREPTSQIESESKRRKCAWEHLSEEERKKRIARSEKFGTKDELYEEYKKIKEAEDKKAEQEKHKAEQQLKLKIRQQRFSTGSAA